jgi:Tripartite tricarboxylate transporter family receptor/ABC transporter substrate binding protein
MIGRREFITLLGGATAAWPLAVRAQQAAMPVIGFLSSQSAGESAADLAGFRQGLIQAGYIENQNVGIEYRWAENRYERLPSLAADLVDRRVTVIAAVGGPVTALAVKAATKTVPFVFITGVDPVKMGLVANFARPGGNATGVNMFITAVEAKRLGLLHELVPAAAQIGVIVNPNSPEGDIQLSDLQTAARAIGRQLHVSRAGKEGEIDTAFATLAPGKASQGTAGVGSPAHVSGAYFQKETGTRFQLVPYRGAAPAMQDLVAGQIDLTFDQAVNSLPHVRGGKIKAFAVTANTRLASAPEIPTVDEGGLPGFYISIWSGMWAPKGTPKDVVVMEEVAHRIHEDHARLAPAKWLFKPFRPQRFLPFSMRGMIIDATSVCEPWRYAGPSGEPWRSLAEPR